MDFKAIGKVVRARRRSRKILQADLAEIAGISQRTLRDIEKGAGNPELATLMKLCQALGMEVRVEIVK